MSMTVEEAIAKFKRTSVLWESASNTEMVEAVKVAIAAFEEIQQYRAIGTVSEFRQLKEKATAKKPIDVRYFAEAGYSIGLCPTCNSGINSEFKYCGDCCQCLDWSEGKE